MLTLLIMYVISGIILCALSLPLIADKIGPNGLYGFRIKATMEKPRLWYGVNKYAGKRLLVAGIITILAALGFYFIPGISIDIYALGCLAVFAVVIVSAIIQCVIYLKSLQKE